MFYVHFLAFSGTNLLTRCRSVSSCFLLFLCFKKVVHEIFSELHGTKTQHLIFRNEAGAGRGAEGGKRGDLTRGRRGQAWARAWPVSGPTRSPPTPPFRLFILL